jgi:hypothetical protein
MRNCATKVQWSDDELLGALIVSSELLDASVVSISVSHSMLSVVSGLWSLGVDSGVLDLSASMIITKYIVIGLKLLEHLFAGGLEVILPVFRWVRLPKLPCHPDVRLRDLGDSNHLGICSVGIDGASTLFELKSIYHFRAIEVWLHVLKQPLLSHIFESDAFIIIIAVMWWYLPQNEVLQLSFDFGLD